MVLIAWYSFRQDHETYPFKTGFLYKYAKLYYIMFIYLYVLMQNCLLILFIICRVYLLRIVWWSIGDFCHYEYRNDVYRALSLCCQTIRSLKSDDTIKSVVYSRLHLGLFKYLQFYASVWYQSVRS